MVHHEINQHPDPALLRGMGDFDKITGRTVAWIDAVVVGNVLAVIATRRHLERHQPDRCDPEHMRRWIFGQRDKLKADRSKGA